MALGVMHHVRSFDLAQAIQVHFDFRQRQFDGSAFAANLSQLHCQGMHVSNELKDRRIESFLPGLGFKQVLIDLLVVEPIGVSDHAVVDFRMQQYSLAGVFHEHRLGQASAVGLQGSQMVADRFGQHWNDTIGQIHAVAPLSGFLIENPSDGNKERHIGDVDLQLPISTFVLAERDRIIEIPSVDRIDRQGRDLRQIFAPLRDHLFRKPIGLGSGVFDHAFGKLLGKRKLDHHGHGVDSRIPQTPEHLQQNCLASL